MALPEIGTEVIITHPEHPHCGCKGRIIAEATGGPRSVGLDWEVELDDWHFGAVGCFVANDEVRLA